MSSALQNSPRKRKTPMLGFPGQHAAERSLLCLLKILSSSVVLDWLELGILVCWDRRSLETQQMNL